MYRYDYHHRVRYRECDRMGVVYHTHYVDYFEAARTEALREMGLAYKSLEDSGIIMPVVDLSVRYRRPARYDDELVITSMFDAVPSSRVNIGYEVRRKNEKTTLVTGEVTLCFVDQQRNRPVAAPGHVRELFEVALKNSQ